MAFAACSGIDVNVDDTSGGSSSSSSTEAGISWPNGSYSAVLGTEFTSPVLTNPHSLPVSYSSSDKSVATIDSEGTVSLVAVGTTVISAAFAGNSSYQASTVTYTLMVTADSDDKQDVEIYWDLEDLVLSVTIGDDFTSPSLVNREGVAVTYSSSNTAVATVDSDASVTILSTGRTVISATFLGDDDYNSASASYTLVVMKQTSGEDDGAGTFYIDSSDSETSEDNVGNSEFDRTISIVWSSSGVTVSGDYYGYVSADGADVVVDNPSEEKVIYNLSGTSSAGSFKLYSERKQALVLDGLTLTNPSGAAINVQSKKRTFVVVKGSNTLSDGSSAAYTSVSDEDCKAVFFAESQLVFSGTGSLTVNAINAQGKAAITSDDYIRMMSAPKVTIVSGSSAGHGLRGKDYVLLDAGTLDISVAAAAKKGISSDDVVTVNGGTATIKVTGGTAYDSDDSEYKGCAGIKADKQFVMTGGNVTITATGAGGKGVRAGSYDTSSGADNNLPDSRISGGTLTITTTGSEQNSVSSKGIKIGFKHSKSSTKADPSVSWGGGGGPGGGGPGGGGPGGGGGGFPGGDDSSNYDFSGNLIISGGVVTVNCSKSEAIEAKGDMTISGGEVYAVSNADDAVNCQGEMDITGGYVYAYSSANDALDSNGDMKLSGGYVMAVSTAGNVERALDANTEGGYKLYIESGATVVAYGGLESGYSASQSVYTFSATAGGWNALVNTSGSTIAAFKAPSGISSFTVSAPSLSKGKKGVSVGSTTYCGGIWATSGISGGTEVSFSGSR